MGLVAADPESEGGELLGDLGIVEGRGERDVGVAAATPPPGAIRLDGPDAGNGAVGDVHDAFELVLEGWGDVPPFAVGAELGVLVLAGLAVAAVGVGG